jgi:hypothetical protein
MHNNLPWLANWYAPFHYSNVWGFPHEINDVNAREIPRFHGCGDSVMQHLSSFIEFSLSIGLCHEGNMMNFFFVCLKGDARM